MEPARSSTSPAAGATAASSKRASMASSSTRSMRRPGGDDRSSSGTVAGAPRGHGRLGDQEVQAGGSKRAVRESRRSGEEAPEPRPFDVDRAWARGLRITSSEASWRAGSPSARSSRSSMQVRPLKVRVHPRARPRCAAGRRSGTMRRARRRLVGYPTASGTAPSGRRRCPPRVHRGQPRRGCRDPGPRPPAGASRRVRQREPPRGPSWAVGVPHVAEEQVELDGRVERGGHGLVQYVKSNSVERNARHADGAREAQRVRPRRRVRGHLLGGRRRRASRSHLRPR